MELMLIVIQLMVIQQDHELDIVQGYLEIQVVVKDILVVIILNQKHIHSLVMEVRFILLIV